MSIFKDTTDGLKKFYLGDGENPGMLNIDYWMGDKNQPGLMGTGKRQVQHYTPNEQAAQMPRYGEWQGRLDAGAQAAAGRQAPRAQAAQLGPAALYGGATIDQGQQAQFRQGQTALADMLMQQAQGKGPSLAQGQLQQATDRNLAQALAAGAALGANGGGATLRNIMGQRAAIGQQAAADSGLLRMQEQMAAQNQLGQVLAGARGQDIGLAVEQAGFQQQAGLSNQNAHNQFALQQGAFQQQTNLANQGASLQQQAMNDDLVRFYTQAGLSLDDAQRQAAMEMERMRLQGALGFEGLENQAYYGTAGNRQAMTQFGVNSAINGLSSLGTSLATGGAA